MSFFGFKSKKHGSNGSVPPTTRNLHTSDGTPNSSIANGRESTQSPTQGSAANGSFSSLSARDGQPWQHVQRERADSDVQVRKTATPNGQVPNAALYPWSQRRLNFPTPQSNPFPRYGAAVNSVASKDGEVYMMGGLINGSMVKGDLWMVESGGANLSCYSVATVSEGPGPRVGHSSLLVGNAFIVFGGDTKMVDSDALDDTLYLLNTSSRQWSRAAPAGQKPAGRYGHTLNILGSKIYIFGGQVEGYFFNDLLAFDLNQLQNPANQWDFLIRNSGDGGPGPGHVPPARTNHSVIGFQDRLYLFGGTNGVQWFNDVWCFDPPTNSWMQLDCIGYIPTPREGHSAAVVGDVMYIFGGRTEDGDDLGDLAAFRLSTRRWYTFQNMGPSPSPRSGHSMTAHGKHIVVLAGEPSSAPKDPAELSMVYILDTSKIRYPNDQNPPSAFKGDPLQRPSSENKNIIPTARSLSREGQNMPPPGQQRSESALRDHFAQDSAQTRTPDRPSTSSGPQPLRGSVSQGSVGPPPQAQAPDPRTNPIVQAPPIADTPTKVINKISQSQAPPPETTRAPSVEGHRRTASKDAAPVLANKGVRPPSPDAHGRRTPTQGQASKAKAMEAGEAAPMMSGPARQRSLRSQRAHSSMDSSDEGMLGRSGSGRVVSGEGVADARSLRSLTEEPKSPKLTAHQEALIKELEATKSRNAWYASELALARKAGFQANVTSSPTFDDRAVSQFGDEDRPLLEAFLAMRAELGKMQQTVEQQAAAASKQVAEVEHQRDAAVSEAAYARAKLAAHSGSAHGTPQPDSTRGIDDDAERTTDISRRLALALAAQSEHKSKIEVLTNELGSERRAREFAEEAAESAQKSLDGMGRGRNPVELEGLRSELHKSQTSHRDEASQRVQAEEKLSLAQVDREEIARRHEETSARLQEHMAALGALQAAVVASSEKAETLDRHLVQEREQKESLESKLISLRAQHEERTSELESTARRLHEIEEIAETHAKEAATHRMALVTGLGKATVTEEPQARDGATEQRVLVLQQSADRAHSLAKNNREAADLAAQKLRSAEERIAGLETYQEQSSREGLQIRRQLTAALKDFQSTQSENRELKAQLEIHHRDANALAIQHGALKDVLSERDARRSPMFDNNSPGSRFGTPDQNRLRDLESQLQSTIKAHEDTKSAFETREQEADRQYREKLEQLENDYQSAVHYVKGTEKMLKRMKDELSKYKSQNTRLQADLTARGERSGSQNEEDMARLVGERDVLQRSLDGLQKQSGAQILTLETTLSSIRADLAASHAERDHHRANHEQLSQSVQQTRSDLAQLRSENAMLESRASDAEQKVTMLLDQVGQSVGNYRRQSQVPAGAPQIGAGVNGNSNRRSTSSAASIGGADQDDVSSQEDTFNDHRGSMALDSLASELDALKTRWESTSKSYRLSNQFDFEKTPTKDNSGAELSENLANWRKRLEDEERTSKGSVGIDGAGPAGVGPIASAGAPPPAGAGPAFNGAPVREGDMI